MEATRVVLTGSTPMKKPPKPKCQSYNQIYTWARIREAKEVLLFLSIFMFVLSVIFQARLGVDFVFWSNRVLFKTIYFSLILFIAVLPLFIIRFITVTDKPNVSPSAAADIILTLSQKDSWTTTVFYVLSSVTVFYAYFGYLHEEKYTSRFLVQPYGQSQIAAQQLNQEHVFIVLYAVVLGACFSFKRIFEQRMFQPIPSVQQPTFFAVKATLPSVARREFKWAARLFLIVYAIFVVFNGTVYHVVADALGSYTRILDSPLIHFRWYDVYLFSRMLLAGFLCILVWELVDRTCDVCFHKNDMPTQHYENVYECLLQGLQEKNNAMVRSYAYAELARIACKGKKVRPLLFENAGDKPSESLWAKISGECIQTVKSLEELIDLEYGAKKPAAQPVTANPAVAPPPKNLIQLVDKNVFAAPRMDANPLDDRTSCLFSHISAMANDTLPSPPLVASLSQQVRALPNHPFARFLNSLEIRCQNIKYVKGIFAIQKERKMRQVFRNHRVIIWAIQALGSFVSASSKEDPYGYVQRDIGKVLDTLLSCLMTTEKYTQNPPPQYANFASRSNGRDLIMEIHMVNLALCEALYQIRTTYEGYLDEIQVQKGYQPLWNEFITFNKVAA